MGCYWRRATACERAAQSISLRPRRRALGARGGRARPAPRALRRAAARSRARLRRLHAAAARARRSSSSTRRDRRHVSAPRRARSSCAARPSSRRRRRPRRSRSASPCSRTRSPSTPSSALGFRDLHEQRQFVRAELIRLEPPHAVDGRRRAPRFAGRGASIDCRASWRAAGTLLSAPQRLSSATSQETHGHERHQRERRQADRDQGRRRRRRLPEQAARDLLGAADHAPRRRRPRSRRCSSISATTASAPSRWTRPTASRAAPTWSTRARRSRCPSAT